MSQNTYRQTAEASTLQGITACPGEADARCVVLREYSPDFPPGHILVAEFTDPSFMPNIAVAAGVIVERDGILSHAAIVTRELGIPCIVGVREATKMLRSGDRVHLDANGGKIHVLCRNK